MKKIIAVLIVMALMAPAMSFAQTITPKGSRVDFDRTMIQKYAYDTNESLEYIGYADPGCGADEKCWYIQKCLYDANDNLTGIAAANNQADFDKIWDSRESYTYE